MAKKKAPKGLITSWSLSRLSVYKECPAKAKYKYIKKLPEPPNPNMARGQEIHEAAEFYVRGHKKVLIPELKKMKKHFDILRKGYVAGKVKAETQITFDVNWKPTGWFDKDAWARIKIDALSLLVKNTMKMIDYKTGRLKSEHSMYDEQLELYGLAGLLTNPDIDNVVGELWFTDHNKILKRPAGTVCQDDKKELIQKWDHESAPLLNDRRFAPRPGNYCRWCSFSRNVGGPCPF